MKNVILKEAKQVGQHFTRPFTILQNPSECKLASLLSYDIKMTSLNVIQSPNYNGQRTQITDSHFQQQK